MITVKEIDEQKDEHRNPVLYQELYFTPEGFIQLRSVMSMPILGQNNEMASTFSYHTDLTLKENPFALFELYCHHYSAETAIEKFLAYFEIDQYFRAMPSKDEVNVLIAMLCDSDHEQVAKSLKLELRTVECHVVTMTHKLQEGTELDVVLDKFRSKWIFIPDIEDSDIED